MLSTLVFIVVTAVPDIDVDRGKPISPLPCNQGVTVSDVRASPPADVIFHRKYAELTFSSTYDEERMLFVYVDGVKGGATGNTNLAGSPRLR
jgi:hypothetical protein